MSLSGGDKLLKSELPQNNKRIFFYSLKGSSPLMPQVENMNYLELENRNRSHSCHSAIHLKQVVLQIY